MTTSTNTRPGHLWQPIETAPRDGREILGCHISENFSDGPWTMRFSPASGVWAPSWDGSWVIESQTDVSGITYATLSRPTHWQPKPELPKWGDTP
jgi:hypothetical protein